MRPLRIKSDLDPDRLLCDLEAAGSDWLGHHSDPDLGWGALLLRSIDGDPHNSAFASSSASLGGLPEVARWEPLRAFQRGTSATSSLRCAPSSHELVRGFATAKGEVLFRGVPRYDVLARAARMLDEPVVDAAGLAERITWLQGPAVD